MPPTGANRLGVRTQLGMALVAVAVVGVAAALIVSTLRTARLAAVGPAGCGTAAEGSVGESKAITAYEDMRSKLPPLPLNPLAAEAPIVPSEARVDQIDGLPLRWAVVSGDGVYQYFLSEPLSDGMTTEDLMAAGGIELDRDSLAGNPPFAGELQKTLGDRAIAVEVGDHPGTLTWADPTANGIRTHNLYWSDGKVNYALIANRSAAEIINLGRSLVCQ